MKGADVMNLAKRAEVVRAMETIARCVNDEDVFMYWLSMGVADGDIDKETTDEDIEYYCEDESFKELMTVFLKLMRRAGESGGLYADGVVSKERTVKVIWE